MSPTGTAVTAPVHVLVETPLPWPADLSATPLHQAVAAAAGPTARIHGVVPASLIASTADAGPDGRRVVVHVAPDGPFVAYRRHAESASAADVPEMVRAMLDGAHEQPGTDVLVCGHGSRDRCCGSMGTALADRADLGVATHVWRSGHLGGHRFAPTALLLPSGTAWAWLHGELLATIVQQSRPPAELLGHYRGSTAVAHPAGQVAEAAVLALVGWPWLDGPRTIQVADGPAAAREWDVRVAGAGAAWRARVREIGRIPQPVCGSQEPGRKDDPILQLAGITQEASS